MKFLIALSFACLSLIGQSQGGSLRGRLIPQKEYGVPLLQNNIVEIQPPTIIEHGLPAVQVQVAPYVGSLPLVGSVAPFHVPFDTYGPPNVAVKVEVASPKPEVLAPTPSVPIVPIEIEESKATLKPVKHIEAIQTTPQPELPYLAAGLPALPEAPVTPVVIEEPSKPIEFEPVTSKLGLTYLPPVSQSVSHVIEQPIVISTIPLEPTKPIIPAKPQPVLPLLAPGLPALPEAPVTPSILEDPLPLEPTKPVEGITKKPELSSEITEVKPRPVEVEKSGYVYAPPSPAFQIPQFPVTFLNPIQPNFPIGIQKVPELNVVPFISHIPALDIPKVVEHVPIKVEEIIPKPELPLLQPGLPKLPEELKVPEVTPVSVKEGKLGYVYAPPRPAFEISQFPVNFVNPIQPNFPIGIQKFPELNVVPIVPPTSVINIPKIIERIPEIPKAPLIPVAAPVIEESKPEYVIDLPKVTVPSHEVSIQNLNFQPIIPQAPVPQQVSIIVPAEPTIVQQNIPSVPVQEPTKDGYKYTVPIRAFPTPLASRVSFPRENLILQSAELQAQPFPITYSRNRSIRLLK